MRETHPVGIYGLPKLRVGFDFHETMQAIRNQGVEETCVGELENLYSGGTANIVLLKRSDKLHEPLGYAGR